MQRRCASAGQKRGGVIVKIGVRDGHKYAGFGFQQDRQRAELVTRDLGQLGMKIVPFKMGIETFLGREESVAVLREFQVDRFPIDRHFPAHPQQITIRGPVVVGPELYAHAAIKQQGDLARLILQHFTLGGHGGPHLFVDVGLL